MYLVYKNKYVSLECACNFMISYTYPPLITKPISQIVAFKIKRVHIKYIGNVIYVKLIYIIAGITRWYQLCQRNKFDKIVEQYIYIHINSPHILATPANYLYWFIHVFFMDGVCYSRWMYYQRSQFWPLLLRLPGITSMKQTHCRPINPNAQNMNDSQGDCLFIRGNMKSCQRNNVL